MKRVSSLVAIAVASSSMIVVASGSAASAAGCAVLTRTYTEGVTKYAVVKNQCGREITAQVVVNNWNDTNCAYIGSYGTRTYRTGGIASPTADYAREC